MEMSDSNEAQQAILDLIVREAKKEPDMRTTSGPGSTAILELAEAWAWLAVPGQDHR